MQKKAYPHDECGIFVNSPHNIGRWMKSMQEVYVKSPMIGWSKAFDNVTSGWDDMEKQDFKSWMSFYQEGGHQKYKTAQFLPSGHVENGGSFIPTDHLKASLPSKMQPDMSFFTVTQDVNTAQDKEAQKALVEKRIQSLISRLNSAEKLATNPQVQLALKQTLQMSVDDWVSTLQKLKREIQLAPMRFRSASLLDDIVYKNANQVYAAGYKKAAVMLVKVAQITPTPINDAASPVGSGSPGAPATPNVGVPPMTPADTPMGGQPVGPGANPAPNTEMAGSPSGEDAISQFLDNLNFQQDKAKVEDDELEVEDDQAEITVTAYSEPKIVTAQAAPGAEDLPLSPNPAPPPDPKPQPRTAPPTLPAAPVDAPTLAPTTSPEFPTETIEVSEDDSAGQLASGDPFDRALSDVEIKDIVARLEGIASMFKNRQIARQLSIIDLMMDKIGIAPFFPTLAEAMRSALESNQYCQSRVEEILAKLRGTIATPMSQHLEGEVSGVGNEQIQSQLAQQEQAEQARKERRKMLQEKEENEALAPQPPPGQELAGPAQVQAAPPLRPTG